MHSQTRWDVGPLGMMEKSRRCECCCCGKTGLDKVSALSCSWGDCVAVTLPPPSWGQILNKYLNETPWRGSRTQSFPKWKHCPCCYWHCYGEWDEVPIQPARGAGAWGTGANCPRRERAGAGAVGTDHEGSETVLVALGSSVSWDDITALVFAEMFGSVSPVAHEKALYEGTA